VTKIGKKNRGMSKIMKKWLTEGKLLGRVNVPDPYDFYMDPGTSDLCMDTGPSHLSGDC
jgi:hypothetical protein